MQATEVLAVDTSGDIECIYKLGRGPEPWTRKLAKRVEEDVVYATGNVIEQPLEAQINRKQSKHKEYH